MIDSWTNNNNRQLKWLPLSEKGAGRIQLSQNLFMTKALLSSTILILLLLLLASPAQAASCADYDNQAEAQAAADTIDADGDGIYCESLPCPCSSESQEADQCKKPKKTQKLFFSKKKYPNIRKHYLRAVAKGWGRLLVINRPGADERRDKLLKDIPTKDGYDRDEYPPAVGRGSTFPWLMRGSDPVGWKASVIYVPSSENRSHGSLMGHLLAPFCDGTKFRYIFK